MKLHAALDVSRGHVGTLNNNLCLGFVCKHDFVLDESSRNIVCLRARYFIARTLHALEITEISNFKSYLLRFSKKNLYIIQYLTSY
jgi:hypothetical protein